LDLLFQPGFSGDQFINVNLRFFHKLTLHKPVACVCALASLLSLGM
jgi:hypothetical protein